ncbi:GDP-mannose 4,6-dehydratase [bacterium]|nr:GDP-mannose 4,6-dehydratase [bacterium]
MNVLITGITGFVGSHLAEYCLSLGAKVYGTYRWRSPLTNIEDIKDKVNLIDCDLTDAYAVHKAIETAQPERIFHLAAQSFVPTSWRAPQDTLYNNIISELNLFEAIKGSQMRIQIAGSSEEYGMVYPEETPIKETNPLRPLSPYGVSKVSQDMLAYQYNRSYNLYVIRTRAFNHTGPRRGEVFVTSNFAKQIASIEKGLQPPVVKVGNLEAKRDYTDVRDIVRAYWLTLDGACTPGDVYNICSGNCWTIRKVLDTLLSLSKVEVKVETDPERLRPSDVPILQGDNHKFHHATGWQPEIALEKTLEDLLNYWRERV